MVGPKQRDAIGHGELHAVSKLIGSPALDRAPATQVVEVAVESNLPQGDYYLHLLQCPEFGVKKMRAVGNFLWAGLVCGRGAAHDCGDVRVLEPHSVLAA